MRYWIRHMENIETVALTAPVLQPEITEEHYNRAITGASGGCLVADAIKRQYPQFSRVDVDVATIRVTDKERGVRFIYLTPQPVQEALLFFDQGIHEESLPKKLIIRQVAKIVPITRSASMIRITAQQREIRRAELEDKEQKGETLTNFEKRSLSKLRNPKESTPRPVSHGPGAIVEGPDDSMIRVGRVGIGSKTLKTNPNLLAGRNRHFGAKTAVPSEVYKKQLEADVKAEVEKARLEIKAEYDAKLARAKRKAKKSE